MGKKPDENDERAEEHAATDEATVDENASPVRVLSRADILRELHGAQQPQQGNMPREDGPREASNALAPPPAPTALLYTNVSELD